MILLGLITSMLKPPLNKRAKRARNEKGKAKEGEKSKLKQNIKM